MEGKNQTRPWCAKVLQARADADRRAVDKIAEQTAKAAAAIFSLAGPVFLLRETLLSPAPRRLALLGDGAFHLGTRAREGHVGAPCAPSGLLGRETEAAQAQQPAQHTASSEFSRVSNDDGRRRAACEPGRRP